MGRIELVLVVLLWALWFGALLWLLRSPALIARPLHAARGRERAPHG